MASNELTLREVFLADAYEDHVERLNRRIMELEGAGKNALDYLTCCHPHKSRAGNDRLPVVKRLQEVLVLK